MLLKYQQVAVQQQLRDDGCVTIIHIEGSLVRVGWLIKAIGSLKKNKVNPTRTVVHGGYFQLFSYGGF